MAQIVLIDIETYRPGLNNIGDVVSVHEDDVLLGPSYAGFKVLAVPGTAQEVVDLINSKVPQTKHVFRSKVGAGEWSDERHEEKEVWNDGGTWREVAARPKYQVNIALTKELESAVADQGLADTSKLSFLRTAASSSLATAPANGTALTIAKAVEVAEEARA